MVLETERVARGLTGSDVPVSGSVSVLLGQSLPFEAAKLAFAARENLVVFDSLTDVRSSETEERPRVEVVSKDLSI